jgi:hypothetical protein
MADTRLPASSSVAAVREEREESMMSVVWRMRGRGGGSGGRCKEHTVARTECRGKEECLRDRIGRRE